MKKIALTLAVFCLSSGLSGMAFAEECVEGVHKTLSWTKSIKGNANQWPDNAKSNGFSVNSSSGGCTSNKPCVVVYPPSYGGGINKTYGHVAVLYSCSGNNCSIGDSNGICGGAGSSFKKCDKQKSIDFGKAKVIHPVG